MRSLAYGTIKKLKVLKCGQSDPTTMTFENWMILMDKLVLEEEHPRANGTLYSMALCEKLQASTTSVPNV